MPIRGNSYSGDVQLTGTFLYTFLIAGSVFVVIAQLAHNGWRSPTMWIALVWALACLAVGALLGFLFGIPRALQSSGPAPPPAPVPASSSTSGTKDGAVIPRFLGNTNTNLEQISDWLTKIIVGATLVQFQRIPETLNRSAAFMANSLGGPGEKYFAGGIIVYFLILGFLGSYLLTRIYLQPLLARVDSGLPISEEEKEEIARAPVPVQTAEPSLTAGAAKAAKQVLEVSLNELTSLKDIYVWAKSQLAEGNSAAAVQGFNKAIEINPNDIDLRVDYALALLKTDTPLDVVKGQLLDAYKRLTSDTDKNTKERLYDALTYTFAYTDPPDGFMNAIKFGEEYVGNPSNVISDGGIYVTLAAAYGQKYRWYTEHKDEAVDLKAIRDKAFEMATAAIAKNSVWRQNLQMLLDPAHPKPPGEDDLEVFKNDQEFRKLVGLAS